MYSGWASVLRTPFCAGTHTHAFVVYMAWLCDGAFLLQRNAEREREDNDADQSRSLGQPVLYGNQIQLQHMYTKKYLAVSSQTSPLESTNIRVRG